MWKGKKIRNELFPACFEIRSVVTQKNNRFPRFPHRSQNKSLLFTKRNDTSEIGCYRAWTSSPPHPHPPIPSVHSWYEQPPPVIISGIQPHCFAIPMQASSLYSSIFNWSSARLLGSAKRRYSSKIRVKDHAWSLRRQPTTQPVRC